MKQNLVMVAVATLAITACEPQALEMETAPKTAGELGTPEQRLSYTVGYSMGEQLKEDGLSVDADIAAAGMRDALAGETGRLNDAERKAEIVAYQKQRLEDRSQRASKNETAGREFLEANKVKAGVVELPSGLQYRVVTKGEGAKPKDSDTVTVHYTGTLIDGTEFDSSHGRGEPTTFPVTGVIQGWQEILPLMPTGSKWQVFIPSHLAYGPEGAGDAIGPNETLVFDIELLEIKK